jgi:hypothetical protein
MLNDSEVTDEMCLSCEDASDALDDDGYCAPCAFERILRLAEIVREMQEDR